MDWKEKGRGAAVAVPVKRNHHTNPNGPRFRSASPRDDTDEANLDAASKRKPFVQHKRDQISQHQDLKQREYRSQHEELRCLRDTVRDVEKNCKLLRAEVSRLQKELLDKAKDLEWMRTREAEWQVERKTMQRDLDREKEDLRRQLRDAEAVRRGAGEQLEEMTAGWERERGELVAEKERIGQELAAVDVQLREQLELAAAAAEKPKPVTESKDVQTLSSSHDDNSKGHGGAKTANGKEEATNEPKKQDAVLSKSTNTLLRPRACGSTSMGLSIAAGGKVVQHGDLGPEGAAMPSLRSCPSCGTALYVPSPPQTPSASNTTPPHRGRGEAAGTSPATQSGGLASLMAVQKDLEARVKQLETALEEGNDALNAKKTLVSSLERQVEASVVKEDTLRKELGDLGERARQAEKLLHEEVKKAHDSTVVADEQKVRLDELQGKFKATKEQLVQAETKAKSAEENAAKLTIELGSLRQEHERELGQLRDKQDAATKDGLVSSPSKGAAVTGSHVAELATMAEKERELRELQERMRLVVTQGEQWMRLYAEKEKELDMVKVELYDAKRDNQRMANEGKYGAASAEMPLALTGSPARGSDPEHSPHKETHQLHQQITSLKQDNERLTSAAEHATASLKHLQVEHDQLATELTEAKFAARKAKREVEEARLRVEELAGVEEKRMAAEAELRRARSEVVQLKERVASLSSVRNYSEEEVEEVKRQLRADCEREAKRKASAVEDTVSDLRGKLAAAQDAEQDVERRLKKQLEEERAAAAELRRKLKGLELVGGDQVELVAKLKAEVGRLQADDAAKAGAVAAAEAQVKTLEAGKVELEGKLAEAEAATRATMKQQRDASISAHLKELEAVQNKLKYSERQREELEKILDMKNKGNKGEEAARKKLIAEFETKSRAMQKEITELKASVATKQKRVAELEDQQEQLITEADEEENKLNKKIGFLESEVHRLKQVQTTW